MQRSRSDGPGRAWIRASAALLILQLFLAGVLSVRAVGDSTPTVATFDPAATSGLATPLSFEAGAIAAGELSQAWQPGAVLIAASMRIDWPKEGVSEPTMVSPFGWIVYVFAGRGNLLSITFDRATGTLLR